MKIQSICLLVVGTSQAFHASHSLKKQRDVIHIILAAKETKDNNKNPIETASWYAVETFGKVFGTKNTKDMTIVSYSGAPSSAEETKERLRLDNERSYFLSGMVDVEIYSPECVFQDPFVSFQGRDRFVDNLQNLGSFITDYSAKPLSYEQGENSVTTKFMVKLALKLPWKPVLAWPWGVRCVIDDTNHLIVRHEESVRIGRTVGWMDGWIRS